MPNCFARRTVSASALAPRASSEPAASAAAASARRAGPFRARTIPFLPKAARVTPAPAPAVVLVRSGPSLESGREAVNSPLRGRPASHLLEVFGGIDRRIDHREPAARDRFVEGRLEIREVAQAFRRR